MQALLFVGFLSVVLLARISCLLLDMRNDFRRAYGLRKEVPFALAPKEELPDNIIPFVRDL